MTGGMTIDGPLRESCRRYREAPTPRKDVRLRELVLVVHDHYTAFCKVFGKGSSSWWAKHLYSVGLAPPDNGVPVDVWHNMVVAIVDFTGGEDRPRKLSAWGVCSWTKCSRAHTLSSFFSLLCLPGCPLHRGTQARERVPRDCHRSGRHR